MGGDVIRQVVTENDFTCLTIQSDDEVTLRIVDKRLTMTARPDRDKALGALRFGLACCFPGGCARQVGGEGNNCTLRQSTNALLDRLDAGLTRSVYEIDLLAKHLDPVSRNVAQYRQMSLRP